MCARNLLLNGGNESALAILHSRVEICRGFAAPQECLPSPCVTDYLVRGN